MNTTNSRKKITPDEKKLMFGLIWPCILENLTATLVSLVDTAMVGSIGAVATAAVGLCTSPSWLMNGLARSLGIGGTAIIARAIGAGDKKEACYAGRQVLRLSLILSLFITCLTFFGAPFIPVLMRGNAEVCENATLYLRIISFGYLFHYCAMTMGALLRGAGDTRIPMLTGIAANILNVIGNFLLIYPSRTLHLFGKVLPIWGAGWGIKGAAIASAFSIGCAVFSSLVFLSGIGILLILMRHSLAGLFTHDSEVYYITEKLILICAMIQPLNALSIVTQGALNGAGDTLRPLIYSLITMWGIRIVFSWILGFRLGFGVYGIYFSMFIDLAVRSMMLQFRFQQGKWKLARV